MVRYFGMVRRAISRPKLETKGHYQDEGDGWTGVRMGSMDFGGQGAQVRDFLLLG